MGATPRHRVPPSSAVKRQSLAAKRQSLAAKRRPPKAANPSAAGENFLMYPLLFSFWALYPFCAVGRVWSIVQVTHTESVCQYREPARAIVACCAFLGRFKHEGLAAVLDSTDAPVFDRLLSEEQLNLKIFASPAGCCAPLISRPAGRCAPPFFCYVFCL